MVDPNMKYQTVDTLETFATNVAFSWTGTELLQQLGLEMDQGKVRLESSDTCIAKFADNHRGWGWFTRNIIAGGRVVDWRILAFTPGQVPVVAPDKGEACVALVTNVVTTVLHAQVRRGLVVVLGRVLVILLLALHLRIVLVTELGLQLDGLHRDHLHDLAQDGVGDHHLARRGCDGGGRHLVLVISQDVVRYVWSLCRKLFGRKTGERFCSKILGQSFTSLNTFLIITFNITRAGK